MRRWRGNLRSVRKLSLYLQQFAMQCVILSAVIFENFIEA
jgi:hypothetical protein